MCLNQVSFFNSYKSYLWYFSGLCSWPIAVSNLNQWSGKCRHLTFPKFFHSSCLLMMQIFILNLKTLEISDKSQLGAVIGKILA